MSQQKSPVERAVELLVYAPLGVAMFARDTVPTFLKMFVARGQTELQQRHKVIRDQVQQYRTVGRFAVRYGGPEVRRQAEERVNGARKKAEETFSGLVVARAPEPGPAARPATESAGSVPPPAAPSENGRAGASRLAIPDYDMLSASQVVERLAGLAPSELTVIREYEQAHRGRNTILGKIAQLTA